MYGARYRGYARAGLAGAGLNVAQRGANYVSKRLFNKALDKSINLAWKYGSTSASKKQEGGAAPLRGKRDKRKRKKQPKSKLGKTISRMKSQIKDIKQASDASTGTMTYRYQRSNRCISANNIQQVADISPIGVQAIETCLNYLKWFDPATPGTLVQGSGVTGTYQRNVHIASISNKIICRNNYQTDAKVKIYLCSAKDDINDLPTVVWASAMSDGTNLTSSTDLGQYPTDYDVLKDMWRLKLVANKVLSPGQSVEASHTVKDINYDPATTDTQTLAYQREYKSHSYLVVVQGTLAHDTALDQQGINQAGVDILLEQSWKVIYDAGVNIKYTQVDVSHDTPTNGFVQSHQPIPDNIAYSVS